MKNVEAAIQKAVIRWVKETYPDVIITATANERSYREPDQIGSLGITDLLLFTPCGNVLFLELKTRTGSLSPSQIEWNDTFDLKFAAPNYRRDVAYGFSAARASISRWLSRLWRLHEPPRPPP